MNTPIRPLTDMRRTLDIDLVADFTCPWSWLGMAQLTRALGQVVMEAARRSIGAWGCHAEGVPPQARLHIAREVSERARELRHTEP